MAEDVFEVKYHDKFLKWRSNLKDMIAEGCIAARIRRIKKKGHFGDEKYVGDDVWEMRVDSGPGYRLYYTQHEKQIIMLLCGGDKSTQSTDIKLAKKLAKEAQSGWMG